MAGSDLAGLVQLHLASTLRLLPLAKRWALAKPMVSHRVFADDPVLPLMIWYGINPAVGADRAEAVQLLEYLVSDAAQKIYAEANFEYPIKQGAQIDPLIAELGTLKVDGASLTEVARHRDTASQLVDRVGFNQ